MRKRWRVAALAALGGVAILGIAWAAWRGALCCVPNFYAEAVAVPASAYQESGEALERNVLALHHEVQEKAVWSTVITDDQVNGWLAVDLPEKFPQLLPAEIQDPRVAFQTDRLQLACRFSSPQWTSVVSVALEVRLAEEPNTLAVRIRGARAGLIPLPLTRLLDHITAAAQRVDVPLRWAQVEGDPVAMVTIVELSPLEDGTQPQLERIEVREGELHLVGHTVSVANDPVSTSRVETPRAPRM
ncbi:MAG: hypothetical protein ACYC6N_22770 [Pirellulaceae bacterium]